MRLTHLTAHALGEACPLDRHARFAWLWIRLRETFPLAVAACLMPDHVHLALPGEPADAALKLSWALRGHARCFGLRRCWGPVAEPVVFSDPTKVRRQLRYIALNPCRPANLRGQRIRLVSDPLSWWWSTHRGTMGAAVEPWVLPGRLSDFLEVDDADFASRWHRYVSGDPSVHPGGTPAPALSPARRVPHHPLDTIRLAAMSAVRASPHALRRRSRTRALFITLAHHEGWRFNAQLARACGITPRSARRRAAAPSLLDLPAARRCLEDPRLRDVGGTLELDWATGDERPYFGRSSALSH